MLFGWMFTDEIVFTKLIKILLVVSVTLTMIIFCRKLIECVYAPVGYTIHNRTRCNKKFFFSCEKFIYILYYDVPSKFHKFKIVKKLNIRNFKAEYIKQKTFSKFLTIL